jgi:hypothetical protein
VAGKQNGRGRQVQTALPGVQLPATAGTDTAGELELEPFERTVSALRAELGDELELKLKVWRLEGKARVYCDAYPIETIESDEAFQERIRADWGGGTYRVILHDGTGFRINREIRIAARPDRQAAMGDATAAAIVRLEERLAALQAAPAQRETERDWLEKLKLYRDVLLPTTAPAPRESPAKMIGELLAVMQGAKELRAAMGDTDAAAAEPSIYSLGQQVLSLIQGAVMQPQPARAALPAVTAPAAIAPPASSNSPAPGAIAEQTSEAAEANAEAARAAAVLRQAVAGLNAMASFNANAESAADMIFDQAPDQVLAMLERTDWWDRLRELAPDVAQFEPWYRTVHAELMALWTKEKQRQAGAAGSGAGATASDPGM